MTDSSSARGVATLASLALLVFAGLSAVPLAVWLQHASNPYAWKSLVTMGAVVGGVVASGAVWRTESRAAAALGVVVMLGSLARVGLPAEWSGFSFLLIAVTFVLLMPVLHAVLSLR